MLSEILGLETAIEWNDIYRLVGRLMFDLSFASAVIFGIYARRRRRIEFEFTFVLCNLITFLVCVLLRKVSVELGFALGLFGLFGILRYRTEQIAMRELTYLFISIGLAIFNATANSHVSLLELSLSNGAVVVVCGLLELRRDPAHTPLVYDRLELLGPGQELLLREDVAKRTGLRVERVDLVSIDLLRDTADLVITHPR